MDLLKKSDEFFNEEQHSNDTPFSEELQKDFANGTQPLESHKLPEIELPQDNRYNSHFAKELGNILAPNDFFRRFDKCVTPKRNEDGRTRLEEVGAHEFRTLIERYCAPWKWNQRGKRKKVGRTMSLDTAHVTLCDRDFLEQLRPVGSFNLVRLPARYSGIIQPLPIGYCPIHRAYTAPEALSYPEDTSLTLAKEFFENLFQEFPFVGDRQQAISNVVAGALTLFCARLFSLNVVRPGFGSFANSEGAGKTLLLKIGIIPVLGNVPVGTRPKDEDEMRKLIAAAALGGSPVFCLDNVKGHLSSPALEALITSPVTSFRLLGQNKMLQEEHGLTIFITANSATFSPDLRRRIFAIELFLKEVRTEDRKIQRPLDDDAIVNMRSEILGALWSLVSNWFKQGCPPPSKPDQSFLAWSKVVGGVLETAGYPAPCHTAVDAQHGDRDLLDMQALVGHMVPGTRYKFTDLVDLARHHRLFEFMLGESSDQTEPDCRETNTDQLDRGGRRRFSYLLTRFLDRIFPNHDTPVTFQLLSRTARKVYRISPVNNGT